MQLEPDEIKAIITRLKRANGHLASVIRMLEEIVPAPRQRSRRAGRPRPNTDRQ